MKRYYSKGELIRFSLGVYSDYCTGLTYEVLSPIDLKEYSDKFKSGYDEGIRLSIYKFCDFLEKNLPLKAISVEECYIGAYDYDPAELEKL
jgi:hypothetical protein